MNIKLLTTAVLIVSAISITGLIMPVSAQDSDPKAVPQNREEILKALDNLKHRQPRLPLPADEPTETPVTPPGNHSGLGGGIVNNARMRNKYLPTELQTRSGGTSQGSPSGPQPDFGLPTEFSTQLFWIVSRLNNCHYCLGHQETKLKSAGATEESLLALDTNWATFPLKQQVAFHFTKKLTFAPHTVSDADIEELQKFFSNQQILDMTFLVGRYNSTNRWTDSLGIPQEDHRDYTSELAANSLSTESTTAIVGFPTRKPFTDWTSWEKACKDALQPTCPVCRDGQPGSTTAPGAVSGDTRCKKHIGAT
jgi:AhpD family alkylhydroperoxidase